MLIFRDRDGVGANYLERVNYWSPLSMGLAVD